MIEVEKILENKRKNDVVCFVGDGINDAPVLMRADVGISMGGIGSDSAIEASDAVLMHDSLKSIVDAKKICKKT
jgi:Cd2+/Zn2+-exporting ATPase